MPRDCIKRETHLLTLWRVRSVLSTVFTVSLQLLIAFDRADYGTATISWRDNTDTHRPHDGAPSWRDETPVEIWGGERGDKTKKKRQKKSRFQRFASLFCCFSPHKSTKAQSEEEEQSEQEQDTEVSPSRSCTDGKSTWTSKSLNCLHTHHQHIMQMNMFFPLHVINVLA